MKEKVLNWLKYDRSFITGAALYQAHGDSMSLKRIINLQGDSEYNLKMLINELSKLAGIHHEDLSHILSIPVSKPTKKVVESVSEEVILEADQDPVIEDPKPRSITAEEKVAVDAVRKAIRLRDEFPFLKEADCPNELKILVADMLTSYDKYKAAHAALFTPESEAELVANAKDTVEEFLNNRMIWAELNYYRENKTILGEHPIFNELQEMAAFKSMSASELAKKKNNLRSNVSQARKKIEEGKNPDLNNERLESIASKERMIVKIDELLAKK